MNTYKKYNGYLIENRKDCFSIYLKMPSGDLRPIEEVKTLEDAEDVINEEVRIMSLLKNNKNRGR